jgi:hypothetical protein
VTRNIYQSIEYDVHLWRLIFYAGGAHQLKRRYFNSFTQANVHVNENEVMRVFTLLAFNEDTDDEAWEGRVTTKRQST